MTVYYIYKGSTLHGKTWSVATFLNNLRAHHRSVTVLKAMQGEYMRIQAGKELYTVYDMFKGASL